MKYCFVCRSCDNEEEKDIPMADYNEQKEKQVCSKCGGKMARKFEAFKGAVTLCSGMYGIDSGKGWTN